MNTPIITEDCVKLKVKKNQMKTQILIGVLIALVLVIPPVRAQDAYKPVWEHLQEAGMVGESGASQTVGDLTITALWAYADVNQLAVSYTLAGPGVKVDVQEAPFYYFSQAVLTTPDGGQFSQASGYTLDASGQVDTITVVNTFYAQVVRPDGTGVDNDYFAHTYGSDLPDSLPLSLSIEVFKITQGQPPIGEPDSGIGSAVFDLTVPLYAGTTLEAGQTHTVAGVAMTLESVTVTPSQTQARVCYDLPDSQDWQPVARLEIGGVPALLMGWGMTQRPTAEDVRRCFDVRFDAFFDGDPAALTLTVDRLRTSEPETWEYWEAVQAGLADYGIVIDVVMSGGRYYDMVSVPEDMTDEQVGQIMQTVREGLLPAIDGPWVFAVDVS
jgi:hypothetical protein